MDYTTLVASKSTPGSLASWANYGLMPASDVLADAQSLIYLTLRVREMISDPTPVSVVIGACNAPLPTGYLDPVTLRDGYGKELPHKDPKSLMNRRIMDGAGNVAAGVLGAYAVFGEKLQFNAGAAYAQNLQMIYYKTPDDLSPSNPTNFLTKRYPNMLRTACLAVAADFRKHSEDYSRNVQRLTMLIEQINRENDLYLRGVEVDADYRSL